MCICQSRPLLQAFHSLNPNALLGGGKSTQYVQDSMAAAEELKTVKIQRKQKEGLETMYI